MPIQIKCECGKILQAKDELAGKKVRCPGCNAILIAPPAAAAVAPVVRAAPPPLPIEVADELTGVTEKPRVKVPPSTAYFDDDDDDDRPRVRKRRRRGTPDGMHTSRGGLAADLSAGIGMMVAGVALFVIPLAFGCFWPYSIVLFIAGVVTLVKGAMRK